MTYIWAREGWPRFRFDLQGVQAALYRYAAEANALQGSVAQLDDEEQTEALIDLMVSEAITTSAIEGEDIDRNDVRSSIRNQLGLNPTPEPVSDPRADGMAALMLSVRERFREPLSTRRLFDWHDMVIADRDLRRRMPVGAWRDDSASIRLRTATGGSAARSPRSPCPRSWGVRFCSACRWRSGRSARGTTRLWP